MPVMVPFVARWGAMALETGRRWAKLESSEMLLFGWITRGSGGDPVGSHCAEEKDHLQ